VPDLRKRNHFAFNRTGARALPGSNIMIEFAKSDICAISGVLSDPERRPVAA
jgi:hypothetical protein